MKYKVIACDHLFSDVLISFRQSISRYTHVFPNCSVFVSFGSYLGILYCFPNVLGYSSFILLGPPILYFYHYVFYFTFTDLAHLFLFLP